MKIVIATNNRHKVREVERILPQHSFLTPSDCGVRFFYPERGRTFMSNAIGKATHCMRALSARYPVLADDSGICVDALGGKPGVHSARFGRGRGIRAGDDSGRNALLLRRIAALPAGNADAAARTAHYVCAAVLIDVQQRIFAVQDRWDGLIAATPSEGQRGFGYDPLFIPCEASVPVAELSDEEKDRHSHRAKALRALVRAYTEGD